MNKVSPSDNDFDNSISSKRVGVLVTKAAKIFGIVSKKFDRPSLPDCAIETGRGTGFSSITIQPAIYQQSSTRQLAFGNNSVESESSKPLNDFYNNTTLTTVSKMFCAVILLTAFVLVMSRSFSQYQQFYNQNQQQVVTNSTIS
ncbi:unnamed protein product [Auanema sp. JU1783]|nr:unnamed protein product [Auanema sp. JU1783]